MITDEDIIELRRLENGLQSARKVLARRQEYVDQAEREERKATHEVDRWKRAYDEHCRKIAQ